MGKIHLTDIIIELFPDIGWRIPVDARLFVDTIISDSDDQSMMQTLGPFTRESTWVWKLTGNLEINTNVMSVILVGYIPDVPEQGTLQIGSVNLDDSELLSVRLAPNQKWSDVLRDNDDQPTSTIMALIVPDEAIRNGQQAELLWSLGSFFQTRFEHTGVLSDLEEAIKNVQQAVLLVPDEHPSKPGLLRSLGSSFHTRFELTGVLSDLEEAIKNVQQAVLLTPDGHPNKTVILIHLGSLLRIRFERTGVLSDLEEAIRTGQQALLLAPDGHSKKPVILSYLGSILRIRFELTEVLSDLEEAIKNGQQAVLLAPDDDPEKPAMFTNLGASLLRHFWHTRMLTDLEEAIKALQQAESLTSDRTSIKLSILSNLGQCFLGRFEHTGLLADVEEAIKYLQHAVRLTPDKHPDKPVILDTLGNFFRHRFTFTWVLDDIEEAIKNQQQALLLAPDGYSRMSGMLNDLGNSFYCRFDRTRVLSDLEEVIKNRQQALLLTSDGDPSKPGRLSSLGVSLLSRFEHKKVPSDLEEAIKNGQQAVLLTPDEHPDKPTMLFCLANSFRCRFKCTEVPSGSDIEEAIRNGQQAVFLTPDGHLDKPFRLVGLGESFYSRFEHTKSVSDRDEAMSFFRSAGMSSTGSPSILFQASRSWARLAADRDRPSALGAYRRAIDLIPQLAWIGDPIVARHSKINELDDFPSEAAAFALYDGKPDLALEWLELGRSVVWNQLLNLRTSVDDLCQAHPDLGRDFTQVSHELQSAATRTREMERPTLIKMSLEEETQHHHRLAEKWDSLVAQIRLLPDFGDFLLPKNVSVLKKAADWGPVVVINVHSFRCDALILEQGRNEVHHIPLDNLRYEDVVKMRKILREDLARGGHRGPAPAYLVGGSGLERVLSKLYSTIVHPILQGLGLITGRSNSLHLPRIWWCPTSILTFLPLHAAGQAIAGGRDETSDYVVSSYTPTVNALLEARAVKQQPFNQLVAIGMVNTPHLPSLPNAEKELVEIGKLFLADSRWRFDALRNEQATRERVLANIANSSWVHLACHAVQDVQVPMRSGLCLYDQRLMITDIIDKPFANADFAFLSACETATGDEKVSDEAVHITGAMLGAGYRSVIGTMWSIPDAVAPIIAAKVYENLLSGGEPNSERSAQALHEGVKELRKLGQHSCYSWVPFVHYGV